MLLTADLITYFRLRRVRPRIKNEYMCVCSEHPYTCFAVARGVIISFVDYWYKIIKNLRARNV